MPATRLMGGADAAIECQIRRIGAIGQRSFNRQSTAFVMRGLSVRLRPLALVVIVAGVMTGGLLQIQLSQFEEFCRYVDWHRIRRQADRPVAERVWAERDRADHVGRSARATRTIASCARPSAELEEQPNRSPATSARLGVCLYLLGRYSDAVETLAHSDGGALTHFYLGKAYLALDKYAEALTAYESAEKAGYSRDQVALAKAEALRYNGRAAGSAGRAQQACPAPSSKRPSICTNAPRPSRRWAAIRAKRSRCLERAVAADGSHAGALFGLALENDRHGNDSYARDLYERAASAVSDARRHAAQPGRAVRRHAAVREGAAVLPADSRRRSPIIRGPGCSQKDADAARDMYYDEDARRRQDRLSQVLGIPVTDFELSVRSRNCLQKMGIMTLGDLTRTSEQELLASKNFGETSLVEIRDMLQSKGLELGQFADQIREEEPAYDPETLSADERAHARSADRRFEPLGAGPQVHGPAGPVDDRRIGSPHGRRPAWSARTSASRASTKFARS